LSQLRAEVPRAEVTRISTNYITPKEVTISLFVTLFDIGNPTVPNEKASVRHLKTAHSTIKMCTTKLVKSSECPHSWLVIDIPCGPGKGFLNCKTFSNNRSQLSSATKCYRATKEDCPWHGLKGAYDLIRLELLRTLSIIFLADRVRTKKLRTRQRRKGKEK